MLVSVRHAAMCCALTLLLTGCSQQLKVEGQVTLDGKPVDSGSISFEPADGAGAEFGGTITNGSYVAEGPPTAKPGAKIVRIRASQKTGKQIPAGSPFPEGTMTDEVVTVPADYNDKSKLTADVKAGANQANFELVSQP